MKHTNTRTRIKAVIFDFDDTLINTKEISIAKHKEAAKELGIQFDERELIKRWGEPWPQLLYNLTRDRTDEFVKLILEFEDFGFEKHKGVDIALSYLKSEEILIGVLSSSRKEWIIKKAQNAGIDLSYFDASLICGQEDVENHKPHQASFTPIIKHLSTKGIKQEGVVYCGDNIVDFETAKNAKINFVAVTTGFHTMDDFVRAGLAPNLVIDSLDQLPEKIKEI